MAINTSLPFPKLFNTIITFLKGFEYKNNVLCTQVNTSNVMQTHHSNSHSNFAFSKWASSCVLSEKWLYITVSQQQFPSCDWLMISKIVCISVTTVSSVWPMNVTILKHSHCFFSWATTSLNYRKNNDYLRLILIKLGNLSEFACNGGK